MNRSFYALLVSQCSTNFGFSLYTMVVVLHLYDETGSTTLAALVTLVSIFFRMMSSLTLPILSEKFKPTHILRFSQITQLVFLTILLLLFLQELTSSLIFIIFIVLAVISFFNGIFAPIKSSIVKVVVPEESRVKANSLLSSVDQTFLFAGWTFGGVLIAFLGKQQTLYITCGLILISIISLSLVKVDQSTDIQAQSGLVERLTMGWKYLFNHKGLKVLIMMDLMEAWVGMIWIGAVTLTYVEDALGKGETWWGYINGGYNLGTIVGGILVFRFSKIFQGRLTTFMLIGSAAFGLLTFAYGFVSSPILALLLVVLMGPSYQMRDLAQETLYQSSTDEATLTKILAAKSTLIQLVSLVSILGIGALTDLLGVRLIYIFSGCIMILSSVYGFINLQLRGKGILMESESAKGARLER
ncbi:MFS transporter [Robertmurraya kyonggiensis]|uniref:MFS transporter n=1 Tax=Robertmurraya kyonggiensis TaxID=1037680 RepID=A0A4U1CZZ7_9BACI|nr:MFS transporter [Robertmurraya kyonggiensis]TKC15324.1 MFS transporter [Robertmurraya kyonggiensis]